jgi:hypothetical protein
LTTLDSGRGTLLLSYGASSERVFPVDLSCTFNQIEGETLVDGDFSGSSVAPADLLSVDVTL